MSNVFYPRLLADTIREEQEGTAYTFEGNDKDVLKQLCDEINQAYPERLHRYAYLAEMHLMRMPAGSSTILLKYIYQFESESCRAVLLSCILREKAKIKDWEKIAMDLYRHFRASSYYIGPPGQGFGYDVIYIAYDNAFKTAKSPEIVAELIEFMRFRREVYILALTAFAIAKKWAPKELGEIMANHLMNKHVTRADIGLPEEGEYIPPFEWIVKQSTFNAILCLQFYPSQENLRIIMEYTNHPNADLAKFAQEHADKMKKKLLEM